MGSLIFQNHKIKNLIDLLLTGDFDENRPLTLTLVSCYFSSVAANEIIDCLVKKLKGEGLQLEKIQFYIDRGIALEIGKKKLLNFFEELKSRYPNLIVEFHLNYFNKLDPQKYFKKYNEYYDIGWGNYGISTDFGYWIPQQLLDK
jgi:hypothetical protein